MTNEIQIHDLRLSFIWVETVLDLLGESVPSGAPLAFLGRRYEYIPRFRQALQSGAEPGGLQPPWLRLDTQFFWTHYLRHVDDVDSSKETRAWRTLVPFRGKVPATVEAPWLPGRLVLEAFFYPHGLALVVTAYCNAQQFTLDEAVTKAFEVRRTGRFQVEWDEGGASESLSLDVFASKALTALRKAALGPGAVPGEPSAMPFTVVTVVRGTGVQPGDPTPDGGKVHRALEAMTTWRPTWRYDRLPNLAEASVPIRTSPVSHVLYGRTRGRAVWFPALMISQAENPHALACYYKNLVFTSLQVESLSGLVSKTAKWIQEGRPLPAAHRDCTKRAAKRLGGLYRGDPNIYRSWSSRAQIEQNNLAGVVNQVLGFFGEPLLS